MVRQTARVVFFEVLGGILFLAVVACAVLAWRLSQGPVALDAFQDDIARALTEARGGRVVTLERAELIWSPERRRVDVSAEEMTFYNASGEVGATAARADIELDASALLLGEFTVVGLAVSDGRIEVRQVDSETWTIAGDPLPPIPAAAFPETPEQWLASLNRVFGALIQGGQAEVPGIGIETMAFDALTVDIVGRDGAMLAQLNNTTGALVTIEGDVALSLAAEGAGQGLPAQLTLGLASYESFSRVTFDVGFGSWTLAEFAARLGVPPDRLSALPADFGLGFDADAELGVTRITARVDAGAGAFRLGERSVPVSRLTGEAVYETQSDRFTFDFTTIDAGLLRGVLSGVVESAVQGVPERPVTLRAPSLRVDAQPMFERAWSLRGVEFDGRLRDGLQALEIDRARAQIAGADIRASGRLTQVEADPGDLPFELRLAAEVVGETGVRTVLDFWPVRLGAGARRFVARNIETGQLTGASAQLNMGPRSLAQGHLDDEALEVNFSVRDATISFLHDMPSVENATGTGRLTGNSFAAQIVEGTWSGWTLETGRVEIPRLNPRGGDLLIEATGTGPVREALVPVFRSRLDLEARTGFDPERVSGNGDLTFTMRRPALDRVLLADMDFTVTGQVRQGGIANVTGGFDLAESTARVDLTKERIAITGFGRLGPAEVNFEWRDDFNDESGPSRLAARSVVTPDVLNRFGLLGRPYITGEVPVEIAAQLDGERLARSEITLDFTDSRIDLAEIGWLKPPGDPAEARIDYRESMTQRTAEAALISEGLSFEGDITLGANGRLVQADLERLFLAGRVDVGGRLRRGQDGALALSLSGAFLDVSSVIPSPSGLAGGGGDFTSPLTIDAEVDRLILGEGLDLREARLAAISTPTGLDSFTASGAIGAGGGLEASYQRGEDGSASIAMAADDAGALIETFFDTDFLRGGVLDMQGTLRSSPEASDLNIIIRGSRMRNAPFLTQILSLASLRGLADTLGGEGVLFSEINLPLRMLGGRFAVDGGQASGPALGLTLNGWLEPESGDLSIDGVLVPSFGVNSALGGVPIIGDLFVSRDGEGVFSLTYSVRGELAAAQVAVNPLSAITPGVLRRIFENPSSTELPLPDAPEDAVEQGEEPARE